MPELPEVETVKRELEKTVLNKVISKVVVNNPKVIKQIEVSEFCNRLAGVKVKKIFRKGKVLIFELSSKNFLIIHFRMSGWFSYGLREEKARVVFQFSGEEYLNYMNQRLLGELRLVDNWQELKFIKMLGPEALELTLNQLTQIIQSKKRPIKPLLMEQNLIAGVGNIYAQEALFLSGINPQRLANSLSVLEVKALHKELIKVLKEGIKYRGSSVDSYRNTAGDKGGMEKRLKVYGRKNMPCLVCGRKIKKIILSGRGTCFCEICQR